MPLHLYHERMNQFCYPTITYLHRLFFCHYLLSNLEAAKFYHNLLNKKPTNRLLYFASFKDSCHAAEGNRSFTLNMYKLCNLEKNLHLVLTNEFNNQQQQKILVIYPQTSLQNVWMLQVFWMHQNDWMLQKGWMLQLFWMLQNVWMLPNEQ